MPRPDGSPYSGDPKVRFAQMTEDGKIGGELNRINGSKGQAALQERRQREAESANAAVAAAAGNEREAIIAAYADGLRSGNHRVRLQAANELLRIEREHLDAEAQTEQDEWDRLSIEDQWRALQQMTAEIPAMVSDSDVVDGEVVELVPYRSRLTA